MGGTHDHGTLQYLHSRLRACKHDWRIARLTEPLLMGHTWKSVRNVLAVSKPEFDQLLDDAIEQARTQQAQAIDATAAKDSKEN
jgi:hypothetical protein